MARLSARENTAICHVAIQLSDLMWNFPSMRLVAEWKYSIRICPYFAILGLVLAAEQHSTKRDLAA